MEAFVGDETPQAWVRLVDRLLSSPEFGVRWGRHWLDVAGYAESEGGDNSDGSNLERITFFKGFDGFPMFSADGKYLVFASNRNQKKKGDTNLFIAEWNDK